MILFETGHKISCSTSAIPFNWTLEFSRHAHCNFLSLPVKCVSALFCFLVNQTKVMGIFKRLSDDNQFSFEKVHKASIYFFKFIYLGTTGIQTGQNPKEYPQNFMIHNKKKIKVE